jgi:hypothetical protein
MYKKLAITISLALAITAGAQAAAITWGATVDNGFSLDNGSELPQNNLARIGVFSLTDQEITNAASTGNYALLDANFLQFGSARIGEGVFIDGHLATISNTPNTIPGRQMMYWVYSSTNNSSDTASRTTATQIGIFYLPIAVNPAWAVPVDTQTPGVTTVDITDLTNAAGTALVPEAKILWGNFPKGTSSTTAAPNFGIAPPIPEPSTVGLLSLTALAFLARRRAK